jgi:hypothetical protein
MFLSSVGAKTLSTPIARYGFSITGEGSFLEMVSEYFTQAGKAANIP